MIKDVIGEKINTANLQTLIKISHLINFILGKKLIKIGNKREDLLIQIENIKKNKETFETIQNIEKSKIDKSIIEIRLASIMKSYKWKTYIYKEVNKGYTLYKYDFQTIIYINKEYISQEIIKEIEKSPYEKLKITVIDYDDEGNEAYMNKKMRKKTLFNEKNLNLIDRCKKIILH